MQIGRVTDLPEPSEVSEVGSGGVELSVMASATQARQLLDIADNTGERFVPVVVPSAPSVDGLYQVTGVNAGRDPNLHTAGLSEVRVSLAQVQGGRQVANYQLLLRGDNRQRVAGVGLWAPLFRVGLPGGVAGVSSLNAGAGGWRFVSGGLERVDSVRFGASDAGAGAAVTDGTFGYFGTGESPAKVIKVDLNSMAVVGSLTLNSGENSVRSAVIDGTHAYFGTNTSPGRVVKVALSTLTRVGAVTLGSGENELRCAVTDGTHGYFGTDTAPGRVVKVDLAGMTRVGAVTLNTGENNLRCAVTDGTHGYFGGLASTGRVVKVDLATMARVDALTLNAGEGSLLSAVTDGTHGYFGTVNKPGRVVKVDLATLTRVGAVTLNSGEGPLLSATILGSNAFFGTFDFDGPPARVVKIDLATLTRTGSITLNAGETGLSSAIAAAGFVYFALNAFPGQVIRLANNPDSKGLRGTHTEVRDNSPVAAARLITTTNRTLSGLTNTGVSGGTTPSADDVILVSGQTTAAQNGLYLAKSGAWVRLPNFTTDFELSGAAVFVSTAAAGIAGVYHIDRIYSDGQDPTTSGRAVRVRRNPGFGLRESDNGGPVSLSYALPLANHYQAACTITDNGSIVTGTRAPNNADVRIDNGLVRVRRQGGQLVFEFAAPDDTTWANGYLLTDDFGGLGEIQDLLAPAVVSNSPEECSLRFRFDAGDSSGTLDVSLLRGIRTALVAITHSSPRLSRLTFQTLAESSVTTSGLSGAGPGYIAAPTRHIIYESADNAQGHRVGASYQGALDTNLISTAPARTHVWGVHAVIGGGAASAVADGIYGMDRTFYGMLSSAASAGVV
jgi:hypothetical protein